MNGALIFLFYKNPLTSCHFLKWPIKSLLHHRQHASWYINNEGVESVQPLIKPIFPEHLIGAKPCSGHMVGSFGACNRAWLVKCLSKVHGVGIQWRWERASFQHHVLHFHCVLNCGRGQELQLLAPESSSICSGKPEPLSFLLTLP